MIREFLPSRRFSAHFFVALTALLIVAWVVSLFKFIWLSHYLTGYEASISVTLCYGTLNVQLWREVHDFDYLEHFVNPLRWVDVCGSYCWSFDPTDDLCPFYMDLPLPCLISATALTAYIVRREFRFSLKFLLMLVALYSLLSAWYGYWEPSFRPPLEPS